MQRNKTADEGDHEEDKINEVLLVPMILAAVVVVVAHESGEHG